MKRLFLLNHGLASGGTDSFVINVAKNIDRSKWDVSLVLALNDDGSKQFRENEILDANIPIYRTNDLSSVLQMIKHSTKLYRLLKEHKVDVFHSNMDLLNGLNCMVAWAAGVPVRVSHAHTSASQYETKTGKHLIVSIYRTIMRFLCSVFSNRKVGCSPPAMAYLYGENWQSKPNTTIISNGIDTTLFSKRKAEKNSDLKTIISVGRLSKEKNPFFALDVIKELSEIRQDFVYNWVGGGALEAGVRKGIEDRNLVKYVQLLGVRKDVDSLLAESDLFIMPSLFEGLGIALIEAQSAGLPCVCSDTIPKLANCGACLFLPLEASATEWAIQISEVLDGKRVLAVNPEKLQKFDISYTISQLDEVYSN